MTRPNIYINQDAETDSEILKLIIYKLRKTPTSFLFSPYKFRRFKIYIQECNECTLLLKLQFKLVKILYKYGHLSSHNSLQTKQHVVFNF
jgi:hypothetical protein